MEEVSYAPARRKIVLIKVSPIYLIEQIDKRACHERTVCLSYIMIRILREETQSKMCLMKTRAYLAENNNFDFIERRKSWPRVYVTNFEVW